MSDAPTITDLVIEICSEETGLPATVDSRLLDDLEMDSLDLVQLELAIEERIPLKTEIDIDPKDIRTVGDVIRLVERMVG